MRNKLVLNEFLRMKGQNMPNFAELIFADSMSRGDFAELIFADTKYKRFFHAFISSFQTQN